MRSNSANPEGISRIKAATQQTEQYTGRCLVAQTWDVVLDDIYSWAPPFSFDWRSSTIASDYFLDLPKRPLLGVSGIFVTDNSATVTQVDQSAYWVSPDGDPGRLSLVPGYTWPIHRAFEGFRIRVVAGYVYPFKLADPQDRPNTWFSPGHALVEGQVVRVSRGLNDLVPSALQEYTDYTVTNIDQQYFQLIDEDGDLVQATDQQGNWSFLGEIPEPILRAIIITASEVMETQQLQGDSKRRYHSTVMPDEAMTLLEPYRVLGV